MPGVELALLSDRGYGSVPDACVEGLAIPRFMAGITAIDLDLSPMRPDYPVT